MGPGGWIKQKRAEEAISAAVGTMGKASEKRGVRGAY